MTQRYNTDAISHIEPDSGCAEATAFLGVQSSCFKCPFSRCINEPGGRKRWLKLLRDKELLELWGEGRSKKDLAEIFGISAKHVGRLTKDYFRD